jgi:hypothetical protein
MRPKRPRNRDPGAYGYGSADLDEEVRYNNALDDAVLGTEECAHQLLDEVRKLNTINSTSLAHLNRLYHDFGLGLIAILMILLLILGSIWLQ